MHWRNGCKSYFLTLTCQEVLLLLLSLTLKLPHVHISKNGMGAFLK
uniref:Uncharacterized protein n=1 Tax=Arundo donax TaxID=35708 RepID=A0A0A9E1D4_ARUDO